MLIHCDIMPLRRLQKDSAGSCAKVENDMTVSTGTLIRWGITLSRVLLSRSL